MNNSPTAGLSPLMDMRVKLTKAEQRIEQLEAIVEAVKKLRETVDDWAADAGGYHPVWFEVEEALLILETQT